MSLTHADTLPPQQVWASGDFAMVATTSVIVPELLCEAVDVHAGQQVLDVATGSGNAALAAARCWCTVHGIDFVPALLDRARERARAERLPIGFQLADARALPFPDDAFDVVLSVFGAMFVPDQEQTAREMIRVCRPGGRIGMANWTPDGFIGTVLGAIGRHVSPSPGQESALLWGSKERIRDLFSYSTHSIRTRRRTVTFRYRSADHFVEFFRTYYGPTLVAFEALDATGQRNLTGALIEVVQRFNRSGDATMVVPADYLEIVIVKTKSNRASHRRTT